MKNIIIINGPNLNLLGKREPEIYGSKTFDAFFNELQSEFPQFKLDYFQSNIEGELIDKLHDVGFSYDGIVLNAAPIPIPPLELVMLLKGFLHLL